MPPRWAILRWGILISRYINIAHPGYNTIILLCMPLSRIHNSPNSIFDLVFHFRRTRGSLGGLFLNVCFAVIQMVGTQGSNVNQTQSLEEVMVAEGLSFFERTCTTAQCSGCQLGCFGGQNLLCSIYRKMMCSCSYCLTTLR